MQYFYLYARHDISISMEVYNRDLQIWVPLGSGSGEESATDYGVDGALNGTNATFTTSQPFKPGSVKLYLNGVRQFEGEDYTVTTTDFTFTIPPEAGSNLIADYIKL